MPSLGFSPDEICRQRPAAETVLRGTDLFREAGCLHLKGAFRSDLVKELFERYVRDYNRYFCDEEFSDALGVGDKRTMVTVDVEGPFNSPDLYANPLVYPLLRNLLGPELILGSFGSVVSLPGALDQYVHVDHPNLFQPRDLADPSETLFDLLPPFAATLLLPLVPLNPTNGTTRLWPGSHRASDPTSNRFAPVDPVADVGDCLLLDYRLLHGGTANRSRSVRPVMYLVYHRPWFRDWGNFTKQDAIRMSATEYEQVPAPLRPLFRFAVAR